MYSNNISVRQQKQSNQLSFPLQDDCKTRKDKKQCIPKQRQTQNPHNQWKVHKQQINNNRTTTLEWTAAYATWGLKFILYKSER